MSRGGRSTLELGSWSEEATPSSTTRYVVASVIHHEFLHAELGTEIRDGRRHHQTPEIRRRERDLAEHDQARRWIHERLGELLERRRLLK